MQRRNWKNDQMARGDIEKQETNPELRRYFELVNSESKQDENSMEYYIHNGLLMKRWKSKEIPNMEDRQHCLFFGCPKATKNLYFKDSS